MRIYVDYAIIKQVFHNSGGNLIALPLLNLMDADTSWLEERFRFKKCFIQENSKDLDFRIRHADSGMEFNIEYLLEFEDEEALTFFMMYS